MNALRTLGALTLGVSLVAGLSRPPAAIPRSKEGPLLPRVQLLHVLGAAQQNLIADYYWLQTIQQIGRARYPEECRDIFAYADLTTNLDPTFAIVYAYGATTIPYNAGREHWLNTDESTRLIRKGLSVFPDDSRLLFFLAYNLQYFDHKYREAAQLVQRLSQAPGTPPYLKSLATRLFAMAGEFDSGIALAEALRDSATDEESRAFFQRRILEIHQEKILRQLDAAIQAYLHREGHLPLTVEELLLSGELATIPADPLGGSFLIDAKGRAQSTSTGHRLELYERPERPDRATGSEP